MSTEPKYLSSLRTPRVVGFSWQDPEDDADRKTFRDILERGCHILTIEDGPGLPVFSYSLGFFINHQQPELFIMGVSAQLGGNTINRVFELVESGSKLGSNQRLEDIFSVGQHGLLVEFPKEYYLDFLGYACWFHRSLTFQAPVFEQKFPVLQLLWPDKDGRFPNEKGCHPSVATMQRLRKPAKNLDRPNQ